MGAPEHGPIDILEDEIAKVAATFKTTRYGGRTRCLALIVDQEEMRRVTKDGTLDCTRAPNPPLLIPRLSDTTTATDGKTFATEHRQVWFEYYLDRLVEVILEPDLSVLRGESISVRGCCGVALGDRFRSEPIA